MEDRKPLVEVIDKSPAKNEPVSSNLQQLTDNTTIQEMKDLKQMSIMFGFDGNGFDGYGQKAEEIYQWLKKDGIEPMERLNYLINVMGDKSTKGNLISRVHQWVKLQSNIVKLESDKRSLEKTPQMPIIINRI